LGGKLAAQIAAEKLLLIPQAKRIRTGFTDANSGEKGKKKDRQHRGKKPGKGEGCYIKVYLTSFWKGKEKWCWGIQVTGPEWTPDRLSGKSRRDVARSVNETSLTG